MTKKLSLLFLICILSALNINAEVYEGSCGTNVRYSLDTSTGLLSITGTGAMTNYSSYSSAPWKSKQSYVKTVEISNGVTSIGRSAFDECSGLTSVTIPNSVTSIGDWAFRDCSGLTSVSIPNSVTSIGDEAFSDCSGLTSVTIPNSVTSIGNEAFSGCSGLTSISVESGNEKYDSRNNCNAIIETASNTLIAGCKNTTIPNSVTSIGSYAFAGCKSLTSVTIPNSVTSIGSWAFDGCSGLTSVTIPNSVTSIGYGAFAGCKSLTSVTIPNSVTSIGNEAFSGCSGLTKVTLNSNAIASKSYSSSSTLRSIFGSQVKEYILGNEVTSIGSYAFYNSSGLTSVIIPNSVTSIGYGAFSYCSGLTKVTLNSNAIASESYSSSSTLGSIFGSQVKEYILGNEVTSIGSYAFYNSSGLTSVTIPNSVTSIGIYAFSDCSGLTSVTIPNSVTSIGEGAFQNCSGLTSVTIPNSVTSIGSWAFNGSSGLTSVTIPNSVTSIGHRAFEGCSGLTSVYIPSSVKTIGYNAFANCTELLDVYCYARKSPTMGTNVFANSGIQFATLYVPEISVDGYKATEQWNIFGEIQALSGEYPEVPETTKCATPTIEYVDGKLSFSCETEGVKYVYNFSTPSESDEEGVAVNMPNKLQVSVYAKKDGFDNSDVATKDINVGGGASGIRGDVNNDGTVNMPDAMFIVNKILNGKFPDGE